MIRNTQKLRTEPHKPTREHRHDKDVSEHLFFRLFRFLLTAFCVFVHFLVVLFPLVAGRQ